MSSCQVFFRRCESQRVWPRIAFVLRREEAGSSSRGSESLPDGMCWWRPIYLRSRVAWAQVSAYSACLSAVEPHLKNGGGAGRPAGAEQTRVSTADHLWQVWRTWQATASCALIAPGHAELAALSAGCRLGFWSWELRCRSWTRTAWRVDLTL